MSKKRVTIQVNEMLLDQLQRYADAHGLNLDFVIGVAIDQFVSDPDNFFTYKDGRRVPITPTGT